MIPAPETSRAMHRQRLWIDRSGRTDFAAIAPDKTIAAPRSTTARSIQSFERELDLRVQELCRLTADEEFEDGVENSLSRGLASLILKHGNAAIEAIVNLIVYDRIGYGTAAEILRLLGRIADADTHAFRRWLLERSLNSDSAILRDAASLGLSSLKDPHAIPYVARAISQEQNEELREDMKLALSQLERYK